MILILLAIARKYIYNAYYKRDTNISNSEIFYALKQNFRLIDIYRKENKLYLNHKYDYDQKKDLDHCLKILKNVIDLSPQPTRVIDKYYGMGNRLVNYSEPIIMRKTLKYRKYFAFKNDFRSNKMIFDDLKKIDIT